MLHRPDLVEALKKLDFPAAISEQDLAHAAKDALVLRERLISHSDEMQELLSAVLLGDTPKARDYVVKLRLREEDFLREEGGFLWLVVVVVLLYATAAY